MGVKLEAAMGGTQRDAREARNTAAHGAELEALLAKVAARDRAAFEKLYRRMETHVYNLALKIAGGRADAEEAVQDALLQVWIKAPEYHEGNATGWILRIVARAALRKLRTRGKHQRLDRTAAEAKPRAAAPETESQDREACLACLREHLGALDDERRSVVALYYGASMSQGEIAALFETSQQTISNRLKESLALLRRRLREAGFAGSAAALPLQPGACELLGDAITQGPTPAGLAAKILAGAAKGAARAGRASLRAGAVTSGWGLWVLLAALGAGAGGWYVWPQARTQLLYEPATAETSSEAAPPAAERPTEWYWSFSSGPATEGLRVLRGDWRWEEGLRGEGGMVIDSGCTVLLPIEPQPGDIYDVELAWYFQSLNKRMSLTFGWFGEQSHHTVRRLTWTQKLGFPVIEKGWYAERYFLDVDADTVVETMNDELFVVGEYDPHPHAKLVGLRFEAMYVHSIRVRRIAKDEIPEALRDLEALKKQLGDKPIYLVLPKAQDGTRNVLSH